MACVLVRSRPPRLLVVLYEQPSPPVVAVDGQGRFRRVLVVQPTVPDAVIGAPGPDLIADCVVGVSLRRLSVAWPAMSPPIRKNPS